MSHKNLDNKIKLVFDSMDEKDQAIASARKNAIWEDLAINESNKQKSNKWWLWFLLGSLFAFAGLVIKQTFFTNELPSNEAQNTINNIAVHKRQFEKLQNELANIKTSKTKNEKTMDSILRVNKTLLAELSTLQSRVAIRHSTETPIKYRTDTVYVKELKTNELIVEKVIRDTIIIEVPVLQDQPEIVSKAEYKKNKLASPNEQIIPSVKLPASVQFNFSEANLDQK